jgi:hypothetical protein
MKLLHNEVFEVLFGDGDPRRPSRRRFRRLMGWVREEHPENNVRGIIIVGKKDDALRYALGATSGIEAKEFKLSIG